MNASLRQKQLAIKNDDLKQSINKCLKQIKFLTQKIQKNCNFQHLYSNHSKVIDQCMTKVQQNSINLSEHLLKQQIKVSQSKQASKIVKIYENKILEYRLQMQNKQNFIQEAKVVIQNLFPQDYFSPYYSQMRKFFIESLHRDKLIKLITNLSTLKKQFHKYVYQLQEHQALPERYFNSRIVSNTAVEKLLQKIRQQERKQLDLKQKMRTYKQIIKVLDKESKGMLQQIKMAKIQIQQKVQMISNSQVS